VTPSRKRKASQIEEDDDLPSSQSSTSSRRSSVTPSKKLRGQDLFDSRILNTAETTTTFYRFIASLREKIHDEVKETSNTHKFVRILRDGGRLMRCYTQNIDGLEAREGLVMDLKRGKGNKRRFMKKNYEAPRPEITRGTDWDGGCEVVQLHGDLDSLRCSVCSTQWTWTDNETEVYMDGFAPSCEKCAAKSEERQKTGKRGLAVGSLRPNIVLYGEEHPQNALLSPYVPYDAGSQPDVLIIMGTSLKVFGLQKIIREFAKATHAQKKGKVIFVNRTRPAESVWDSFIDYFVPMDCDDWIDDLKRRRSDLWLHQGEIDVKAMKPLKKKRKSDESGTDATARPAKKPKVVVQVPRKQSAEFDIHESNSVEVETRVGTPRHSRKSTKTLIDAEGFRSRLLSPLARQRRPPFSPLGSHLQQQNPTRSRAQGRATPKAPNFSPLTPWKHPSSNLRNLHSAEDSLQEIQESDHEKENWPCPRLIIENDITDIAATPTKTRVVKHALGARPMQSQSSFFGGVMTRVLNWKA
jgi:NAD-dependent SIR2 family protein deacetylase